MISKNCLYKISKAFFVPVTLITIIGTIGCKGNTGPKGEQGLMGTSGMTGATGATGAAGGGGGTPPTFTCSVGAAITVNTTGDPYLNAITWSTHIGLSVATCTFVAASAPSSYTSCSGSGNGGLIDVTCFTTNLNITSPTYSDFHGIITCMDPTTGLSAMATYNSDGTCTLFS